MEILSCSHSAATGLRFLRSKNIVHRDLKPGKAFLNCSLLLFLANILVKTSADDLLRLKLCDFTYARYMSGQDLAKTVCGSPLYMVFPSLRFLLFDRLQRSSVTNHTLRRQIC